MSLLLTQRTKGARPKTDSPFVLTVVLTTLVKLLLTMSRKMGKKLKEPGKTLSEGSPTLAMGFYSPRAFPRPIPFGNGTPGLIGWHPWPILAPGVLRSWENSFFPHHAAPLGFIRALPSHKTLPGRIPIRGKPLFPSHSSPASQVPLPINYFQEDAHLWEMVPPAIPPSGYLSWPLCNPSLICSFMYAPIYSKYI